IGLVSTAAPIILPNNGLVPATGGTATLVAAASASLPIASTGFCWSVQLHWTPSAIASLDDIDGWQHFAANSKDDNQDWRMSDNEQNHWQGQSLLTDTGATALLAFPANIDYSLILRDVDPVTAATLAPEAGTTLMSTWTANVSNEFGAVLN